ncbi:MAG: DUF805 domain-containing protein [Campylobacterales bacterium]|nr:DUF805 domain-containing protein [Campylobacterales bacterium]
MEMVNWYLSVLKNYTGFTGRAGRAEIWFFILAHFLVSLILNVLSETLGLIYALAVLVPSIAVGIRRMHDIGKSGWWLLVGLIPVLGLFVLIYFYVLKSEEGENAYGASAPTAPY